MKHMRLFRHPERDLSDKPFVPRLEDLAQQTLAAKKDLVLNQRGIPSRDGRRSGVPLPLEEYAATSRRLKEFARAAAVLRDVVKEREGMGKERR